MDRQKKQKAESVGTCNLCDMKFSKRVMTRHLASCSEEKNIAANKLAAKKTSKNTRFFHIVVEGRYQPEYWLHIAAPVKNTLADIDSFLREIWLECCGHLSAFTIGGISYAGGNSFYEDEMDDEDMDIALYKILTQKMKFYYAYDFGTSTELALKVVSEYESMPDEDDIQLLARNDPLGIKCDTCGKDATQICTQCVYDGQGMLCDTCASNHECGEDMLLPVVNSPRMGMCSYCG